MTTQPIDLSLKFLDKCQSLNKKMWLRQVIVPNINDNIEYIEKLANFIKPLKNIEKVELLPYHTMAIEKYKTLNGEELKTCQNKKWCVSTISRMIENPKYKGLNIPYPLKDTLDMNIEKCKELENILINKINCR